MKETTYLMIASAAPITTNAPALSDFKFFPFSCHEHEVAEAISMVQDQNNVKAVGVISKDMAKDMLNLMEAFERS